MKAMYLTLLLFSSLTLTSCQFEKMPTILMVGDSWGQLMCVSNSFDKILKEYGFEDQKVECLTTTKSGSWARDWAKQGQLDKAISLIKKNPSIKTIYLTIGGNDILGLWKKSFSDDEDEQIISSISADIKIVIDQLLKLRNDIRIVISGYDYPNFDLLINSELLKNYILLYESMEKPSPMEINRIIYKFSLEMKKIHNEYDRVFFAPTLGIGHHRAGIPELNISPGTLPAPTIESISGGDMNLAQTRSFLLNIKNTNLVDPYHLNPKGYENYVRQIMETQLKKLLQN